MTKIQRLQAVRDAAVKHYGTRIKKKYPIGSSYGHLTVAGHRRGHDGCWRAICKCACGATKEIRYPNQMVRGLVQSCGCLSRKLSSERLRGKKPIGMLPPGEAAFTFVYNGYKRSARVRGFDFAIPREVFKALTAKPCSYCGSPPAEPKIPQHYNGNCIVNGIDRVDSAKGYTPDNVVPCCKQCNRAKRDLSHSEFLTWIKRIAAHQLALAGSHAS